MVSPDEAVEFYLMKGQTVALLALVIALAGCSVPGAPRYSDTPQSLFQPATHLSSLTLKRSQHVGVIFDENTQADLAYLNAYNTQARTGVEQNMLQSSIQQAYINSSSPTLAIDAVRTSLQQQFASVAFYPNLTAMMAARPDVIVVLDTRSTLATERSSDIQASVQAQFFDANLAYMGEARGMDLEHMSAVWTHTKRAPEIAAQVNAQRQVQINALQRFDASLKAMVARIS